MPARKKKTRKAPAKKKTAKKKPASKRVKPKKITKKKAATKKKKSIKKKPRKKTAAKKSSVKKRGTKKPSKKASKKKSAAPKSRKKKLDSARKPVAPPRDVTARIYGLYEKALALLHKNNYQKARESFVRLLEGFPAEIEIAARIRSFIRVCDRHLQEPQKARLRTSEDIFNQAVVQHNQSQYEEALVSLSRALKLSKKRKDHIHYAMAATEVCAGNFNQALQHLKKAISLNQENRFFASNDPDFEPLADNKIFLELVRPE